MNVQNKTKDIRRGTDVPSVSIQADKLLKNHQVRHGLHRTTNCNRFIAHHTLHNKHRCRSSSFKRKFSLRPNECYCNITARYKYLKSMNIRKFRDEFRSDKLNKSLLTKGSSSECLIDCGNHDKPYPNIIKHNARKYTKSTNNLQINSNISPLSKSYLSEQINSENLIRYDNDGISRIGAHSVNHSNDTSLIGQSSTSSSNSIAIDTKYFRQNGSNKENCHVYFKYFPECYKNNNGVCECCNSNENLICRKMRDHRECVNRQMKQNNGDFVHADHRANIVSAYTSPVSSHQAWVKEIADFRQINWFDCHYNGKINSPKFKSREADSEHFNSLFMVMESEGNLEESLMKMKDILKQLQN